MPALYVPTLHNEHTVFVVALHAVNVGAGEHTPQVLQALSPFAAAYCPAEQLPHALSPDTPPYAPAVQLLHAVCPSPPA